MGSPQWSDKRVQFVDISKKHRAPFLSLMAINCPKIALCNQEKKGLGDSPSHRAAVFI